MCRLLFSAAASVKNIGKWRIIAAVFSKTKGLKMSTVQYRRVLLKLSGESLMGKDPFGINRDTIMQTARQIKEISDLGVEIAIVVGGGNIFRGVSAQAGSMDRATADYMGMLATVMNALALKDALESIGAKARVQSALAIISFDTSVPYSSAITCAINLHWLFATASRQACVTP